MSFKGTYFCNYDLDQNSVSFKYMPNACLNGVASFKIPASNTVGVAEIQTVPQCDMVEICISFRGT